MSELKKKLFKKIEGWRPRTVKLLKEHGDVKLGDVTITQAIGGMRGVKCLITDISYLDPFEGIRFRGFTIPEVLEKLPKPPGAEAPYVEGFIYLLLTVDMPTVNEVNEIAEEFNAYEYKEGKINRVIKDWKGFEDDETGKPIPCNAEMKKVVYLYNPELIDAILAKADELTTLEESIKEAEVKN